MKLFLYSLLLCFGVSMQANALCPEGHITCPEAARLNKATNAMNVMTGIASPVILTCEEEPIEEPTS